MGAVDRWTGEEAKALRLAKRMSLAAFAAHLGISERTLSTWECKGAGSAIRPANQEILDTSLRASTPEARERFYGIISGRPTHDPSHHDAELLMDDPKQVGNYRINASSGVEPAETPRVLTTGRASAAEVLFSPYHAGRLASAANPDARNAQHCEHTHEQRIDATEDIIDVAARIHKLTRAVDFAAVSAVEENLDNAITGYETLEHGDLARLLVKQRRWIDDLTDRCHGAAKRRLYRIAGKTAGLLGHISTGRGNFPLARTYCLEAFHLAEHAHSDEIKAWVRGTQSFCEYYAGNYELALSYALDGKELASSGPQSVRLSINGEARARGKLGDTEGVHRAIHDAYQIASRHSPPPGIPSSIGFDSYSQCQIAANAATAYLSVGLPNKVEHYAGLALPEIAESGSPWSQTLVTLDIASAIIASDEADLDRAAHLVNQALTISANRPIISVRQRTSDFVSHATSRWGLTRELQPITQTLEAQARA